MNTLYKFDGNACIISICILLQFIETLKPNYNSVDLSSVELVDSDLVMNENNSFLMDVSLTV